MRKSAGCMLMNEEGVRTKVHMAEIFSSPMIDHIGRTFNI